MYTRYEWDRQMDKEMREEQRRLVREVNNGEPMSWKKLGKIIQLNALMRSGNRHPY